MHHKLLLAGMALSVPTALAQDNEEPEYDDMGPAAFMWPADRVWAAHADNTAPCGSVARPSNRTSFPTEGGELALVAQDESYDIELSISYSDDPRSNDEFTTLIDAEHFREIDTGHTCIPVASSPDSVKAGDVATFQIRYITDFDKPENQTFYACADIIFVDVADFDNKVVPCFNATGPEDGGNRDFHDDLDDDDEDTDDASATTSASPSSTAGSGDENGEDEESNSGGNSSGSSGLSGGAIAGIVVGAVAGVGLIAAAGLLFYRRKQKKLMAVRQQSTSRGVKWGDNDTAAPTGSVSSDSVRMQNMSA